MPPAGPGGVTAEAAARFRRHLQGQCEAAGMWTPALKRQLAGAATVSTAQGGLKLHLERTGLGDQHLPLLTAALDATAAPLSKLSLAANGLTDRGLPALLELVARPWCSHLTHLDLSNNAITNQGADELAEALLNCAAPPVVNLAGNHVDDEVVKLLSTTESATASHHNDHDGDGDAPTASAPASSSSVDLPSSGRTPAGAAAPAATDADESDEEAGETSALTDLPLFDDEDSGRGRGKIKAPPPASLSLGDRLDKPPSMLEADVPAQRAASSVLAASATVQDTARSPPLASMTRDEDDDVETASLGSSDATDPGPFLRSPAATATRPLEVSPAVKTPPPVIRIRPPATKEIIPATPPAKPPRPPAAGLRDSPLHHLLATSPGHRYASGHVDPDNTLDQSAISALSLLSGPAGRRPLQAYVAGWLTSAAGHPLPAAFARAEHPLEFLHVAGPPPGEDGPHGRGLEGKGAPLSLYQLGLATLAFHNLRGIRVLNVAHNALRDLAHLPPSLVQLDASCNAIADLRGLAQCSQLEVVNLRRNCIRDTDGLQGLMHLRELYLGRNTLNSMANIEILKQLLILDLTHNAFRTLAQLRTLSLLAKLRTLLLTGNAVTQLPGYAIHLRNLLPALLVLDGAEAPANPVQRAGLAETTASEAAAPLNTSVPVVVPAYRGSPQPVPVQCRYASPGRAKKTAQLLRQRHAKEALQLKAVGQCDGVPVVRLTDLTNTPLGPRTVQYTDTLQKSPADALIRPAEPSSPAGRRHPYHVADTSGPSGAPTPTADVGKHAPRAPGTPGGAKRHGSGARPGNIVERNRRAVGRYAAAPAPPPRRPSGPPATLSVPAPAAGPGSASTAASATLPSSVSSGRSTPLDPAVPPSPSTLLVQEVLQQIKRGLAALEQTPDTLFSPLRSPGWPTPTPAPSRSSAAALLHTPAPDLPPPAPRPPPTPPLPSLPFSVPANLHTLPEHYQAGSASPTSSFTITISPGRGSRKVVSFSASPSRARPPSPRPDGTGLPSPSRPRVSIHVAEPAAQAANPLPPPILPPTAPVPLQDPQRPLRATRTGANHHLVRTKGSTQPRLPTAPPPAALWTTGSRGVADTGHPATPGPSPAVTVSHAAAVSQYSMHAAAGHTGISSAPSTSLEASSLTYSDDSALSREHTPVAVRVA